MTSKRIKNKTVISAPEMEPPMEVEEMPKKKKKRKKKGY